MRVAPRRLEIDVFGGDADGVVIAEVELANSDRTCRCPRGLAARCLTTLAIEFDVVRWPEVALARSNSA